MNKDFPPLPTSQYQASQKQVFLYNPEHMKKLQQLLPRGYSLMQIKQQKKKKSSKNFL